jgi:hypothetical protein
MTVPMTSTSTASHLVSIDRVGRASVARTGSVPGPSPDGAAIYEIQNCPATATAADVAALAQGLALPSGIHAVDYSRLAARQSGSCCGGCCG